LWIGLLGGLLVGIVALNVMSLSFSSSSSGAAGQADELRRVNSTLRAQIAEKLSRVEVQSAATKLGLRWPAPSVISYVRPSAADAAVAAKRLRNGELTVGSVAVATSTVPAEPIEPVVTETPAAAEVPVTDPATVAPETTVAVTAPPVDPAVAPVGAVATP